MANNVEAFTKLGATYPGFVNLTQVGDEVKISVRADADTSGDYPVEGASASVSIPKDEFIALVCTFMERL